MAQIAVQSSPLPILVRMGRSFRVDEEELFEICVRNPELRIERTAEGDLVVMTPVGGGTSHRNLEIVLALGMWAKADGQGVAFDATGGFVLPNGAMRSPDAAWVLRSRLDELPPKTRERFLPLCPDFVVELRSPSDALADLQAKMEEYRANGARLGWLIDPQERRVHVYRPHRDAEVLDHPGEMHGHPELPGFNLEMEPVWEPL